jgi:transposase-like protein
MGKRSYKNYPIRFRERAVERLKLTGNATRLSEELGIHRTTLYVWKRQLKSVAVPTRLAKSAMRQICALRTTVTAFMSRHARTSMPQFEVIGPQFDLVYAWRQRSGYWRPVQHLFAERL